MKPGFLPMQSPICAFAGNGQERFMHFHLSETNGRRLPNGNRIDDLGFEHYDGKPELPASLRHWRDK